MYISSEKFFGKFRVKPWLYWLLNDKNVLNDEIHKNLIVKIAMLNIITYIFLKNSKSTMDVP